MKIYLIGFMASGKTSIGKRIAKKLDYQFFDMDDYLEEKYHKSIPDIFREDGEDKFREMERDTLHDTFKMKNVVIAAGGGTPCFFDNIKQINKHGTSFYLKRSVDYLVNRLINAKTVRPLVKDKSKKELNEYISKTLEYRKQFYKQATETIKIKERSKDEVAMLIKKIVNIKNS
ncbi:shikimate kinase [Bacteroidota bacterium]